MEVRRRALGRGLGALIPKTGPSPDSVTAQPGSVAPIAAIRSNPFQPRRAFSEQAIEELAASIRRQGLLQPLLVRPAGDGYQLIAGERRFRAAQLAGLSHVPVSIRAVDDAESLELALIENLQRENLNPIEEARAYQRLGDDFGLKQDQIAQQIGKSRSAVTNSLRLLQLPAEVLKQIETGAISAGHARSLLALSSAAAQTTMARDVVRRRLNVRDTERMVRQRAKHAASADHKAAEDTLSRTLGTRVRVRARKGNAGCIEIEYYSLEELNGLIARLSRSAEAATF